MADKNRRKFEDQFKDSKAATAVTQKPLLEEALTTKEAEEVVTEEEPEEKQPKEKSVPPEMARLQEQLKQTQEQLKRQKSLMDTVPSVDLSEEEKKLIQTRKDEITGRYKQLRDKLKGQKNKTALMGLVNLIAQTGMQIAAAQQGLATGRDMSGARFSKDSFMEKLDAIDNRLAELTDKETVRLEDVEKAREEILGRKQKAAEKAKERVADVQRDEQKFANQVMLEQMKQQGKQQEKLTKEQQAKSEELAKGFKEANVALETIQAFNEEALKDAPGQAAINKITKGYDIGLNELGKLVHSSIKNEDPSDYENWIVALEDLTADDTEKLKQILGQRLMQRAGVAPQQQEQAKAVSTDMVRMRFPGDNKVRLIPKDKVDAYVKQYKGQVVDG